jgi:hypothetical protein
MRNRFLILLTAGILGMCQLALAQYSPGMPAPGTASPAPGMPGYVATKSYSVNKAMVGGGIGAAAAGGGLLYYVMKHRGVYEGCVSPDGKTLIRKDGKRFTLEGQSLGRGEKVSFKAKKVDSDSTGSTLEVENLRKDYGPCEGQEASAAGIEPKP